MTLNFPRTKSLYGPCWFGQVHLRVFIVSLDTTTSESLFYSCHQRQTNQLDHRSELLKVEFLYSSQTIGFMVMLL